MPVRVTVQYCTLFKRAVGIGKEEYALEEGKSVADLWIKILEKYGTEIEKAGYVDAVTKEPRSIIISISRIGVLGLKHVDLYDGLKTKLKDEDLIIIYPPIIGG
jgi:molybdopterin converting factor small subunit